MGRPARRPRGRLAAPPREGVLRDRGRPPDPKDAGADAVLLLLRDLDDEQAAALQAFARASELDALVEAHDAAELERGVRLGADPLGVNARDLSTFSIDRRSQLALVRAAPRDRVLVAESAIASRAQAAAAELAGADVLVGTTLMRAESRARSSASFSRARSSRSAG